ncbi:MAG: DegV family protein [Lachnospiraceae bacterium]|nr:DegV family protein [Lachnospiraceae bacterium]
MSVAILTDTNSGFTVEDAEEKGIYVIPTPFYIEDKLYYEGVDLDHDKFFELQAADHEIHTSMPLVGDVMDKWHELLDEYDEIVYIPLSSGLSSSCETAIMLAEDDDFDGRVFVVNNQRISATMKLSAMEAKALADEGKSAAEIKEYLEEHKSESAIYIMVDTLKYLKRGGRITPAAAAVGSLLHIKPVLQIQGEKLDKFAMARTTKQGKQIMLDAIKKDAEERFEDPDGSGLVMSIAHTKNQEEAEKLREELLSLYPNHQVVIDPLSMVVACHIGPGSLAVTVSKSFLKEM